MTDINKVIIVGRVVREPELKYTSGGTAVMNVSIASNASRKQGDKWVEEGHFFDVTVWGKTAEVLHQYLVKGKQIGVEGELRQERWEQEGQKRSRVKINARNVQLLGGGRDSDSGSSSGGSRSHSDGGAPGEQSVPSRDSFEDDIPF